jgi:DNA-binding Lrp family transcriptional regulator
MQKAWVMLTSRKAGLELGSVIREKLKFPAIEVFGLYDVVIELEASTYEELDKRIDKIREIPLVSTTTTYLVTSAKSNPQKEGTILAYTLVSTEPLYTNKVRDRFLTLNEVHKADIVFGPHDIIVEFRIDSIQQLVQAVKKIFGTRGLLKTNTMISFKDC